MTEISALESHLHNFEIEARRLIGISDLCLNLFTEPFPKLEEGTFSSEELFVTDLEQLLGYNNIKNKIFSFEERLRQAVAELRESTDPELERIEKLSVRIGKLESDVARLKGSYPTSIHNAFQRVYKSLDSLSYWYLAPLIGKPSPVSKKLDYLSLAKEHDPGHSSFYDELKTKAETALEEKGSVLLGDITRVIKEGNFQTYDAYNHLAAFTYGWLTAGLEREKDMVMLAKAKREAIVTEISHIVVEPVNEKGYTIIINKRLVSKAKFPGEEDDYRDVDLGLKYCYLEKLLELVNAIGDPSQIPEPLVENIQVYFDAVVQDHATRYRDSSRQWEKQLLLTDYGTTVYTKHARALGLPSREIYTGEIGKTTLSTEFLVLNKIR